MSEQHSSDTPAAVTPADLVAARMKETMHGHGDNGRWMYEFTCIEFPRLRRLEIRWSRGDEVQVTVFVDGVPVENNLEAMAAALSQPHDLDGCAARFLERTTGDKRARLSDGRLIVEGETAERCDILAESFPAFEGVPITWVAPQEPRH